jgi:hypothetical protein
MWISNIILDKKIEKVETVKKCYHSLTYERYVKRMETICKARAAKEKTAWIYRRLFKNRILNVFL